MHTYLSNVLGGEKDRFGRGREMMHKFKRRSWGLSWVVVGEKWVRHNRLFLIYILYRLRTTQRQHSDPPRLIRLSGLLDINDRMQIFWFTHFILQQYSYIQHATIDYKIHDTGTRYTVAAATFRNGIRK